MRETVTSEVDVERIMYEVRDAVAKRQPGGSLSARLPHLDHSPQNGDSFYLQPPFSRKPDNHYHVNDLLRFHGADFVRNSYLALLQREPDEIGAATHLESLASGRCNKFDVLASLHFSPEGRRSKVTLKGLSLPVAVRRLGRVPLLGYLIRVVIGVARLPRSVQQQNQFEFYLWSQLERLVSQQDDRHRAVVAALAEVSAQTLEGQQAIATHGAQFAQVSDDLLQLAESIAAQTAALAAQNAEIAVVQQAFHQEVAEKQELNRQVAEVLERQQAFVAELKIQERRLAVLLAGLNQDVSPTRDASFKQLAAEENEHLLDGLYAAFEDQFRGKPEEIRERLEVYLPILEDAQVKTVLDVGSGRGEWLGLLSSKGIAARGVDRNRVFIEDCRRAGFDVSEADALDHLRTLPSESLDAVTSFHLVEHLPFEVLVGLLDECQRILKPGGLVILETPNPENFMVGSCNFYTDPTHRHPLPSETLKFLVESRGFEHTKILKLRPVEAAMLEGDSELIRRFNEYFYSAPDYGIISRKPSGSAELLVVPQFEFA